jgi:hypothetical protein
VKHDSVLVLHHITEIYVCVCVGVSACVRVENAVVLDLTRSLTPHSLGLFAALFQIIRTATSGGLA